ncbi:MULTISPECIES: HNH endonuclease [unclassified Streptomyces]|uniref:HNH endonuclease n=1 Tax=unclassified Streptomyces TaxID=2593676 RepID=UPI0036E02692
MTPARLAPPTVGRASTVDRGVTGIGPRADRYVPRPMRTLPLLRPIEPPLYPSRRDVLRRWEELEWWSCAYCDSGFSEMVVLEVDHVRPLAKGGRHEWANLVPSCASCNRAKSDTDVTAWLDETAGESLTD